MRERNEPPEIVQVTLPEWAGPDREPTSSVTLRIPEQGGLPAQGSQLPRGLLLLTVVADEQPDSGVRRLVESLPPTAAATGTQPQRARRPDWVVIALALMVALFIGFLLFLRFTGRG
jgi:hypothetical protein